MGLQGGMCSKTNGPAPEKNNGFGFRPGLAQTSLYSHRRRLEAWLNQPVALYNHINRLEV